MNLINCFPQILSAMRGGCGSLQALVIKIYLNKKKKVFFSYILLGISVCFKMLWYY